MRTLICFLAGALMVGTAAAQTFGFDDQPYVVALEKDVSLEEGVRMIEEAGGIIGMQLQLSHAITALLSKEESEVLATKPGVRFVEYDAPVVFH